MTCDGSRDPAEHAEPPDAQIPSMSKPASNVMLSQPATVKAMVLESRLRNEPRKMTPSRDFTKSISLAVKGESFSGLKTGVLTNRSIAAAKANDAGDVLGAGAAFIFMAAAKNDGIGTKGRFDKKRPGALWAVELMGANGNQIGVELVDVLERLLAKTLHRIGMKNNAMRTADFAENRHGLNRAGFIVGRHDGNQRGIRADCLL